MRHIRDGVQPVEHECRGESSAAALAEGPEPLQHRLWCRPSTCAVARQSICQACSYSPSGIMAARSRHMLGCTICIVRSTCRLSRGLC